MQNINKIPEEKQKEQLNKLKQVLEVSKIIDFVGHSWDTKLQIMAINDDKQQQ